MVRTIDHPIPDDAIQTVLKHCRTHSSHSPTVASAAARLLSSPFIVFPLHLLDAHWAVAVVVDALSLTVTEGEPPNPLILILESLSHGYAMRPEHETASRAIAQWLAHLSNRYYGTHRHWQDIQIERVPFVSALQQYIDVY